MTEAERNKNEDPELTGFMLHHCYTCPNAPECDTEERCRACMVEKRAQAEKEQGHRATRSSCNDYAL